jgi:hypothetical protein
MPAWSVLEQPASAPAARTLAEARSLREVMEVPVRLDEQMPDGDAVD